MALEIQEELDSGMYEGGYQHKELLAKYESVKEEYQKMMEKNKPYTHCELDPKATFGVAASLIHYANHNQAPRNTFQTGMCKQALGIYHSNYMNRYDGLVKILPVTGRPVVETEMSQVIGLDTRSPGMNVATLFSAHPFTEEDAFIFKKEALDSGAFRICKFLTFRTTVNLVDDKLGKPKVDGSQASRYKFIYQGAEGNPMNGLPMIGAHLKQSDCVIAKMTLNSDTRQLTNASTFVKVGDEGIVDRVLVTTDNRSLRIIVKLRIFRVPIKGDKFAPRNAQKGTIGLILSDIDLPITLFGETPTIITNPSSIPSRMTMSYFFEQHAAKHGLLRAVQVNGSSFQKIYIAAYSQTLREYGRDELGYETMYSGLSGKRFAVKMNMGPVFFQALRHHVKDKIQARGSGGVLPLTRQPPKGRANRGGMKYGEMERDALLSHGASSCVLERLMEVSDKYTATFCLNCGTITSIYKVKKCRLCGNTENFGVSNIPYAYKLLMHLLIPMGINLRPDLDTLKQYADKIMRGAEKARDFDPTDLDQALTYELEEEQAEVKETDFAEVYDDYDE